jgi:hypothetical protein
MLPGASGLAQELAFAFGKPLRSQAYEKANRLRA